MKYIFLLLCTIIFKLSILLQAGFTNDDCISSNDFPICLYPDKKLEFIVFRNEREVGWHTVTFKRSDDLIIAETNAFVEAPYLLVFDYTMEYHSISRWKNGKLIDLKAFLNDDGDDYEIEISKNEEGKIVVNGKEEELVLDIKDILPTEHWHPQEINSSQLINTLNGELVNVTSTRIDDNTWYIDGDIKYFIYYDKDFRWTGLKFNADEDNIIEYICKNC